MTSFVVAGRLPPTNVLLCYDIWVLTATAPFPPTTAMAIAAFDACNPLETARDGLTMAPTILVPVSTAATYTMRIPTIQMRTTVGHASDARIFVNDARRARIYLGCVNVR